MLWMRINNYFVFQIKIKEIKTLQNEITDKECEIVYQEQFEMFIFWN